MSRLFVLGAYTDQKKPNKTETHSNRSRLCLSSLKQQFPFLDGVSWMVFGLKRWEVLLKFTDLLLSIVVSLDSTLVSYVCLIQDLPHVLIINRISGRCRTVSTTHQMWTFLRSDILTSCLHVKFLLKKGLLLFSIVLIVMS